MKYYVCPICGYDILTEPPYDEFGYGSFEICHCCGFEYGTEAEYPNDYELFESIRKKWIEEVHIGVVQKVNPKIGVWKNN